MSAPVFNHPDIDVNRGVAQRIVAAGLSTIEFTLRGDEAMSAFAAFNEWARTELPGLSVGVGSVSNAAAAAEAIDLGATFVFAPYMDAEVAATCRARAVAYMPGCATVTEIQAARRLGCDVVKLFPAGSIGGPGFLRAIRAPCPWIRAVPTGGVEPTVESLTAWFDAGAHAVGMGSKLLPSDLIENRDWDAVQAQITATVAAVAEARRSGQS